nr:TlpA disulfide reductase family protein [Mucilaginibacter sp. L294]
MTLKTLVCSFIMFCAFSHLKAQQSSASQGEQAPAVAFQQSIGQLPTPNFYRNKVLVIDFWATWCAPCIAGFPDFNKLSQTYDGNKAISFVTITNEPKAIVQRFFTRTKKQLDALKLIDTSGETMKKFGAIFLPYCIVIDKNNVIRWKGIASDLNKSILDKIILNAAAEPVPIAPTTPNIKAVNKPIAQRALFAFNVAQADSTKRIYEGSGSERHLGDYLYQLSYGNIPLNDFIEKISGFGAATRIISNSATKQKQPIDIYLNLGTDTTQYNNYKNTILKYSPDKNIILSLLATSLNFKIQVIKQKVTHYELLVQDSSKLKSFRSMQTKHSSFSTDNYPRFEVVGYNLKDITSFLESSAKLIITTKVNDLSNYDLSLDITSENTLDKSLQFHGLKLKEVNDEIEFLKLTFNN